LPAGADGDGGVDALGGMERPVVDDLRVLALALEELAVHVELHDGEVDGHGVVVPLVVAHLGQLPAPLGGPEDVEVPFGEVATQQQDQPAVAHEQRVVVPVHLCNINIYVTSTPTPSDGG